jgi:hypothetical protein
MLPSLWNRWGTLLFVPDSGYVKFVVLSRKGTCSIRFCTSLSVQNDWLFSLGKKSENIWASSYKTNTLQVMVASHSQRCLLQHWLLILGICFKSYRFYYFIHKAKGQYASLGELVLWIIVSRFHLVSLVGRMNPNLWWRHPQWPYPWN